MEFKVTTVLKEKKDAMVHRAKKALMVSKATKVKTACQEGAATRVLLVRRVRRARKVL